MADPDRPLFADAKAEIDRLGAELREMLGLRWRLARLELEAAAGLLKRLAIVLAIAVILTSTGLPICAVLVAELLPAQARLWWLLGFGPVALAGGILCGWWAWRRFRRRFVGLEETMEELREDLVWLQEWLGRCEEEGPGSTD